MFLQESIVMTLRGKTNLSYCPTVSSCSTLLSSLECMLLLNLDVYFLIVHVDMLPGLQQGQEKMSKSDPSSSIFMEDEEVLYCAIVGSFNNSFLQYLSL